LALINRTTGEVLAEQVRLCDTFWKRLRGLMFRRSLAPEEAYLFACRRESVADASIHMLFVFYPISVVWLDAHKHVVDVALAKPFRPYYAPRRAAQYFVEGVPALVHRVQVGDVLEF
jgi:uncharacterized membrane protein (UPF0127 family)